MTESKEWVTIKIPDTVRESARDRDATYGELLTFGMKAYDYDLVGSNTEGDVWLNIPDGEVPESPSVEGESAPSSVQQNDSVDTQAVVEELKNELSMANDPGVEVDTETIIGRLDDLQNQLPKDVAEELSR